MVDKIIAIISKAVTYVRRRLSGDKVINQNSRALDCKKSAYQSIGPSRVRKDEYSAEPRFPPAVILYIRQHKKLDCLFIEKPRIITIRGFLI